MTQRKCTICTDALCCICQGINDACPDQPKHPGPSKDAKRIKELEAEVDRLTDERNQLRAECHRYQGQRDDARARLHFGHSGYYNTCLRSPCKDWRAEDADHHNPQAVTQ